MPKLNDYELLEIIGSGSYSVVHRAKHKVSGIISLKLILNFHDFIANWQSVRFIVGNETDICHKMCCKGEPIQNFDG